MRRRVDAHDDELRRVYRTHVRAVFAFVAYATDRDVAEDLTAVTFERVVKSWASYDPSKASEKTWILTIARNVVTDHFRRQRHRQSLSLDENPELLDVDAGDDPYVRVVDADEVARALTQLGERERDVLALRFGADLAATDVASLLGLSESNVHQIASRALKRLRTILTTDGAVSGSA